MSAPQANLLGAASRDSIPRDPGQLRDYIQRLETQLEAARARLPETVQQLVCGQLWDTQCQKIVGPPSWSHDSHPSQRSRRLAAQDRRTPPEVLGWLLQDNHDWLVLDGVSRNKASPPAALRQIAEMNSKDIQLTVAGHRNCPSDVLDMLVQSAHRNVRCRAVAHPACSPDTLERLAEGTDPQMRLGAATHRRCPPSALEKLLQDRDHQVRQAAANNPKLPKSIRAMYQLASG